MEKKQKFFENGVNRLMVTLLLTVAFPLVCGVFFPIFAFLILPTTPLLSQGMVYPWLHIYWLGAAGSWLILLAGILPQMRKEITAEKRIPQEEPSDIDLKKLSSRGSSDVLEETEKELSNRKSRMDISNTEDKKTLKKEVEVSLKEEVKVSRNRLASVEIEATVHHVDIPVKTKPQQHSESFDELDLKRFDTKESPSEHKESLEEDFIPSLGTNDIISDDFSAETVISKSTYSQRVQTFTISEETYECSLPSPTVVSPDETSKNAVFLFVNSEN